jgi:hypothetical protein
MPILNAVKNKNKKVPGPEVHLTPYVEIQRRKMRRLSTNNSFMPMIE